MHFASTFLVFIHPFTPPYCHSSTVTSQMAPITLPPALIGHHSHPPTHPPSFAHPPTHILAGYGQDGALFYKPRLHNHTHHNWIACIEHTARQNAKFTGENGDRLVLSSFLIPQLLHTGRYTCIHYNYVTLHHVTCRIPTNKEEDTSKNGTPAGLCNLTPEINS